MEIRFKIQLIVFLCLSIYGAFGSVTSNLRCTGSMTAGGDTSYTSSGPDNNLGFSYMVEDPDYAFDCCGKITRWEVHASNTGTLQFQVWRRESTYSYRMIGENSADITSTGSFTLDVDAKDQIVVNKGDFIGWHNAGKEMLPYQSEAFTSSNYATMFRRINNGDLHPGDTYNWTNIEAYHDRRYAIRVTYEASDAPTINITNSVTIPDYIKSGAAVTKISWADTQAADNSSLTVYFEKSVGFLTMDFPSPAGAGSGYLTAANIYRPRDTTLTYFAYDTCYNTFKLTQTITVQKTDLIIDNLPATVTTNETGTAEELLHTITCTDPTDQWFCRSMWSTNYPFILKAISTTSYGFYKVEHAVLDYDTTPEYLGLAVECVENRVSDTNTVTGTINVYINKNQPPKLINLDAHIVVDANTSHRGDTVFYINATDPEGDDLTFSATYASQSGRFLVTKNGAVVVVDWLTLQEHLSYTLTVTVTDTASNTDTGYLSIYLENSDYPVSFRNVPSAPMMVLENTANYTTLYKFEYEDLDQNDTKYFSLAFNDVSLSRYFSIDFDTGEFRTSFVEIDFEGLGSVFTYTATVMVGDTRSSATATVSIIIINENEAPRFTKSNFVIEADEGDDGTIIEGGTLFSNDVVDEDLSEAVNAESHEYTLNCTSDTQRFYMTSSSGQIMYQGPYDLDTSGTPSDVDCEVTVVDKFGLSATAGLHIHVKNVNEFSPQFTQLNYSAYVATNTLIGKDLITVSAIDLDNSDDDDNVITYSIDQSAGGFSNLIQISHTGTIYAAQSFSSYTAGATLGPIILQASNYGVASRTGTASIFLVIPQSTTTVTTTTDRNYEFFEDKRNYMWMILAFSGVAIMLFALSIVLFRICHLARIRPWCYACCMRGFCCRPKPEGPRGFGDKGYDLASYGHKQRFNDDEMDGWLRADRSRTIRPGPASSANDDIDGWLRREEDAPSYRQPFEDFDADNPDSFGATYADQPLYEMFRLPDTTSVPAKASYDEPGTSSWKKRGNKRLR